MGEEKKIPKLLDLSALPWTQDLPIEGDRDDVTYGALASLGEVPTVYQGPQGYSIVWLETPFSSPLRFLQLFVGLGQTSEVPERGAETQDLISRFYGDSGDGEEDSPSLTAVMQKLQIISTLDPETQSLPGKTKKGQHQLEHAIRDIRSREILDALYAIYYYHGEKLPYVLNKLFGFENREKDDRLSVFLANLYISLKTKFIDSPEKLGRFLDHLIEGRQEYTHEDRAAADRERMAKNVDEGLKPVVQDELTDGAIQGLDLLFRLRPEGASRILHRLKYVESEVRLVNNLPNLFLEAFYFLYTSEIDGIQAYLTNDILDFFLKGNETTFWLFPKIARLADFVRSVKSDKNNLVSGQKKSLLDHKRLGWTLDDSYSGTGQRYVFGPSTEELSISPTVYDVQEGRAIQFKFRRVYGLKFLKLLEHFLDSMKSGQTVLVDSNSTRSARDASIFLNRLLDYAQAVNNGIISSFELHITCSEQLPSLIRRVLDSVFVKPESVRLYWYPSLDTSLSEAHEIFPSTVQDTALLGTLSVKAQKMWSKLKKLYSDDQVEVFAQKLQDVFLPKPFSPANIFLEDLFELDDAKAFPEGKSLESIFGFVKASGHYNETWRIIRWVSRWADSVGMEERVNQKRKDLAYAYRPFADLISNRRALNDSAIRGLYYIFLGDAFQIRKIFRRFSEFSDEKAKMLNLLLESTDVLVSANIAHFDSDFFGQLKSLMSADTFYRMKAQLRRLVVLAGVIKANELAGSPPPFTNLKNKFELRSDIDLWNVKSRSNGTETKYYEYGPVSIGPFYSDAWNEEARTSYFIHSLEVDENFVDYFDLFSMNRSMGNLVAWSHDTYADKAASYFWNELLRYSQAIDQGLLQKLEIHLVTTHDLPLSIRRVLLESDLFPRGTVRLFQYSDSDRLVGEAKEWQPGEFSKDEADEFVEDMDGRLDGFNKSFAAGFSEVKRLLARNRSIGDFTSRSIANQAQGEPEMGTKEARVTDPAEEQPEAMDILKDEDGPKAVDEVSVVEGATAERVVVEKISTAAPEVVAADEVVSKVTVDSALDVQEPADVLPIILLEEDQGVWGEREELIIELIETKLLFDHFVYKLGKRSDVSDEIESYLTEMLDELSPPPAERMALIGVEIEFYYEEVVIWQEIHRGYTQADFTPSLSSEAYIVNMIFELAALDGDKPEGWSEVGPWAKEYGADQMAEYIHRKRVLFQSSPHWKELQFGSQQIPSAYAQLYFLSYIIQEYGKYLEDDEAIVLVQFIEALSKKKTSQKTWADIRQWAENFSGFDSDEINTLVQEAEEIDLLDSAPGVTRATYLPLFSRIILEDYLADRSSESQSADLSRPRASTMRGGRAEKGSTTKSRGDKTVKAKSESSKKKGRGSGVKKTENSVSYLPMMMGAANLMDNADNPWSLELDGTNLRWVEEQPELHLALVPDADTLEDEVSQAGERPDNVVSLFGNEDNSVAVLDEDAGALDLEEGGEEVSDELVADQIDEGTESAAGVLSPAVVNPAAIMQNSAARAVRLPVSVLPL